MKVSLFPLPLFVALLVVTFGLASVTLAQTEISEKVDAYLNAGEFGPALDAAQTVKSLEQRDELMQRIAKAQFAGGARDASYETATEIFDQQSRSSTLRSLSKDRLNANPDGAPEGARGGGVVADFDPLINLITSTIEPDSWDEVGGAGTIMEFRAGVSVDASGTLRKIETLKSGSHLESLRNSAKRKDAKAEVSNSSELRKVSLNRLEQACELMAAKGQPIPNEMKTLAGIYRIDYLFYYPKTKDIVIAGPAGDWTVDAEGRKVNIETGLPVLNLDDLVVCLRNAREVDGKFGCTINPRPENMRAAQKFLSTSKLTGEKWRQGLRDALGKQDIVVDGIDPQSSTAQVLVEADYRMKLVGMGLEKGIVGVDSYLDHVKLRADGTPPPTDIARWWFTMSYKGVKATDAKDAFQFMGPGVRVLSEQEKLSEEGERIRTGKTGGPTAEFANGFSTHFREMADRYPIYAQLKNVFDFALVTAIIDSEHIRKRAEWKMTFFASPENENSLSYQVELLKAPTEVESVMNHRILEVKKKRSTVKHTIVGVSGGVEVNPHFVLAKDSISDKDGSMNKRRIAHQPQNIQRLSWWWD